LLRAEKLAKSYGGMTRKNPDRNKKAEHTLDSSFGSSAIFIPKDPPLSAPFSREVWLFRDFSKSIRCENQAIFIPGPH
jgi:hypothetical protein